MMYDLVINELKSEKYDCPLEFLSFIYVEISVFEEGEVGDLFYRNKLVVKILPPPSKTEIYMCFTTLLVLATEWSKAGLPQENFPDRSFDSFWWPNRHSSFESEMIYDHQFPATCGDKQFLIFRLDKLGSRNIGSIVTQVTHWFEEAMVSKRVFLFARDWEQASECKSKTWECFFRPISSCSISDIKNISACVEPSLNKSRPDPWNDEINEQCVFTSRSWWRHSGRATKKILQKKNTGWRELRFRAYTYAFFFRHNNRLRKRVSENVQDLMSRNQIDPSKTASMPVRGSDKCKGHDIEGSVGGEVNCTPVERFMLRLKEYQRFYFPNDARAIDTVILTSEDSKTIEKLVPYGKEMGYRMIVNDLDVMQGTGSANDLLGHKNTTKFDVMVSAFTSFQLLLRSEFFVAYWVRLSSYSSWHFIILQMRKEIKEMNPAKRLRPCDIAYVEPRFGTSADLNLMNSFITDIDHDCAFNNQADCIRFMGRVKSSFAKLPKNGSKEYAIKLLSPRKRKSSK